MAEEWPEVKRWEFGEGVVGIIVQVPDARVAGYSRGRYNGYCEFPRRFVKELGYDGILSFVPVHGGITYANEQDEGQMRYGFDCAHSGDPEEHPEVDDLDWMTAEVERLAQGILIAARSEDAYLLAADGEERAEVLDRFHAELEETCGIGFELTGNFGAMINVLGGLECP